MGQIRHALVRFLTALQTCILSAVLLLCFDFSAVAGNDPTSHWRFENNISDELPPPDDGTLVGDAEIVDSDHAPVNGGSYALRISNGGHMAIDQPAGATAKISHGLGAEGEVGDEVAVHDVKVYPATTVAFRLGQGSSEIGMVAREDGGCKQARTLRPEKCGCLYHGRLTVVATSLARERQAAIRGWRSSGTQVRVGRATEKPETKERFRK